MKPQRTLHRKCAAQVTLSASSIGKDELLLLFLVSRVGPALPCNGKVHLVADTHRHPDPASYSWASSSDAVGVSRHKSRSFRGYGRRDKQRGVERQLRICSCVARRQHCESASGFCCVPGLATHDAESTCEPRRAHPSFTMLVGNGGNTRNKLPHQVFTFHD